MDYAAVDAGNQPIRTQFLALTSTYRACLEEWENSRDVSVIHHLAEASGDIAQVAAGLANSPLRTWSETLRRLTSISAALLTHQPSRAPETLSTLDAVLGVLERGVETCLEAGTPQASQLNTSLLFKIPGNWHEWIKTDAASFEARLAQLSPPPPIAAVPQSSPVAAAAADATAAEIEDSDAAFQRELFETFMTEVNEGLGRCEELLVQFEKVPGNVETLNALFRELHTLKGAAAAVELTTAAEQLHQGESLLQAVRDGEITLESSALVDFLLRLGDSVRALIDESCGRKSSSAVILSDVSSEIGRLLQGRGAHHDSTQAVMDFTPASKPAAIQPRPAVAPTEPSQALAALRQKADSGELDPQLVLVLNALDERARHFSQMAASLHQEVKQLRTVPIEDVLRRLQRPVRDAARQEGKVVDLQFEGTGQRIDRSVAEHLSGPLLHLVRNAVAHGIESPAAREAHGKSRTGKIVVGVFWQGADLVFKIEDDGSGLDFAAIRAKAVTRGWLSSDAKASREELAGFIFRPGFSTRDEANELAGRGVGMDVVAREIQALHGRVDVTSREGHGTIFRIAIPTEQILEECA